jgi:hypothetical protein
MGEAKQAEWCIARLEPDMNWWVVETDWLPPLDGEERLSILDPKQVEYMFDLLEPLLEYGLRKELVDRAFLRFSIDKDLGGGQIRLDVFTDGFDASEEKLFALPTTFNESSGTYAEFLDHISAMRVKMLNGTMRFSQKLTVDELEDAVREVTDSTQIKETPVHLFQEILAILEYCPLGFSESDDDDDGGDRADNVDWGSLPADHMEAIQEVSEATDTR